MEGSSVKTFTAEDIKLYQEGLLQVLSEADATTCTDFHSHFLENNLQNAALTHCHVRVLIAELKKIQRLLDGWTMFDNTDACTKQYCCATATHLLLMLATEFNITINRAIAAPTGHGKNLVDGLKACNKQYLKQMMMIITIPGNEETLGK
jgi:hypothetical protein